MLNYKKNILFYLKTKKLHFLNFAQKQLNYNDNKDRDKKRSNKATDSKETYYNAWASIKKQKKILKLWNI
jgi:hypothetical protein